MTQEQITKSLNSSAPKGFVVIDDDYIVIKGSELDLDWIPKTKRLRERGVNYCGPIDYAIYDQKIFLLEHRAKGMVMEYSEYTFNNPLNKEIYIEYFNKYMSILRMFANAPLEQYLKFFADIEEMRKELLKPDVCSLSNLFYNPEEGFSFIDVYPGNQRLSIDDIFLILLNGKFSVNGVSLLPKEYSEEYTNLLKIIYEKIIIGLRKYGYSSNEIKEYVDKGIHTFKDNEIVKIEELNENIHNIIESRRGMIFI